MCWATIWRARLPRGLRVPLRAGRARSNQMAELDDILGSGEDEREQNGYRIMLPGAPRAAGPPQQVAEMQPPRFEDVIGRPAPVPSAVTAGLSKDVPPPAMSNVVSPTGPALPPGAVRSTTTPGDIP